MIRMTELFIRTRLSRIILYLDTELNRQQQKYHDGEGEMCRSESKEIIEKIKDKIKMFLTFIYETFKSIVQKSNVI